MMRVLGKLFKAIRDTVSLIVVLALVVVVAIMSLLIWTYISITERFSGS